MPDKPAKLSKEAAREALWRKGCLRFKLDKNQKYVYDKFYKSKGRRFVVAMGRRTGKSFLLTVLCIEHALRKPKSIIKYGAPTQRQVTEILKPIAELILED